MVPVVTDDVLHLKLEFDAVIPLTPPIPPLAECSEDDAVELPGDIIIALLLLQEYDVTEEGVAVGPADGGKLLEFSDTESK